MTDHKPITSIIAEHFGPDYTRDVPPVIETITPSDIFALGMCTRRGDAKVFTIINLMPETGRQLGVDQLRIVIGDQPPEVKKWLRRIKSRMYKGNGKAGCFLRRYTWAELTDRERIGK